MIHIKKLVCAWLLAVTGVMHMSKAWGAFEYTGAGWPAAIASIGVVGDHPGQSATNPALLNDSITAYGGLAFHKPFQGIDLEAGNLFFQHRIRQRPFIHRLDFLGDDMYTEMRLSSGSAWRLKDGFSVGVLLNYHLLGLAGQSHRHALSLSLSTSARISDKLRLASILGHIIQGGRRLSIPQEFILGLQYKEGPARVLLAFEKEAALPLEVCLGLVFKPGSSWEMAAGYRDLSGMFSAGWRIHFQRLTCHYVYEGHPYLPPSHGFGLDFKLP